MVDEAQHHDLNDRIVALEMAVIAIFHAMNNDDCRNAGAIAVAIADGMKAQIGSAEVSLRPRLENVTRSLRKLVAATPAEAASGVGLTVIEGGLSPNKG